MKQTRWKITAGMVEEPFMHIVDKKGVIALVRDDVPNRLEVCRLITAAPETAAERDRLKTINTELLEALTMLNKSVDDWREFQQLNPLWLAPSRSKARVAIQHATQEATHDRP